MKFPDAVEEEIEAEIPGFLPEAAKSAPAPLATDESLHAQYLDFLRSRVLTGANLQGLRGVLDCANGAAYRLGPELFRSLGCDVLTIGSEPDGRNINAGCGSLHLEKLQHRISKALNLSDRLSGCAKLAKRMLAGQKNAFFGFQF